MSNAAGQILGEIAARLLVAAIEGAIKGAIHSSGAAVGPPGPRIPEVVFIQAPAAENDCPIAKVIETQTIRYLNERNVEAARIENPAEAGSGKLLRLTIDEIRPLPGRRAVGMRADLLQDGAVVASRSFRRSRTSGDHDDCAALKRIARPLGRDASKWVRSQLSERY